MDRKVYKSSDGTLYLVFDNGDGGIYEVDDVRLLFDEVDTIPADATLIDGEE